MNKAPIDLMLSAFGARAGFDTAVSHAVLNQVASGRRPQTFRLHPTIEVVAFGRQDVVSSNYREAVAAARAHGFAPIERLAGGRAAVFHRSTIAFSWAVPSSEARADIHGRFRFLSEMIRDAFLTLGLDARIGELPGEYCPGAYSINLGGRTKVMGVGQRLIRGAAHVGGVIVVGDADRLREVLIPVYRALDLAWDPETAGDLGSSATGIRMEEVTRALVDQLEKCFSPTQIEADSELLKEAEGLIDHHAPD